MKTTRFFMLYRLMALFLLLGGPLSYAGTIVVDSVADPAESGKCTLRQAIENAQGANNVDCVPGSAGVDDIVFKLTTPATINLTEKLPVLGEDVNIINDTNDRLIVRRDTGGDYRIFKIQTGATVTINGLTIENGKVTGDGGGISNEGTLKLSLCTIRENVSGGDGGGIYNGGALKIIQGSISNNVADDNGAGIRSNGYTEIQYSIISGNSAINKGSGIFNDRGGSMSIVGSTISQNTLTGNSIFDTKGAGISNKGTLNIINSTISGNTMLVGSGAGIYQSGEDVLDITNSTITNNTISNTLYGMGGGIYGSSGLFEIKNSIIAGNSASSILGTYPDVYGDITGNNHNLIGDMNGNSGTLGTGSDIVNPSVLLGPLQDNGGPTETHALLSGSPAIEAGDNTLVTEATDQRSTGFDRMIGTVDIGAFEVNLHYEFSADNYETIEGDNPNITNVVEITRTGDIYLASSMEVILTGSSATAGVDFTKGPITLNFHENETTQTVPIELLGNTQRESDRTINLSLDNFIPTGTKGSTHPTATFIIKDDDNHAPMLDNSSSITLTAINENDTNSEGDLISTLIQNKVSDLDGDAIGIVVTTIDNSNGTWQYQAQDGPNFTDFPANMAENQAMLLDETVKIRFVPNLNYVGTAQISFRAWDKTSGTRGDSNVDTTMNGDPTAFSVNIATATITINPAIILAAPANIKEKPVTSEVSILSEQSAFLEKPALSEEPTQPEESANSDQIASPSSIPSYKLEITQPYGGVVKTTINEYINCGAGKTNCVQRYDRGTSVELETVPNMGFSFQTWKGGCANSFKIKNDMTCEAIFVNPDYSSTPKPNQLLDFGESEIDTPITLTMEIKETGIGDLEVLDYSITGKDVLDFSITGPEFPLIIVDGEEAQIITLQCVPSEMGLRTATLEIRSNDTENPVVSYELNCTGDEENASTSPESSINGEITPASETPMEGETTSASSGTPAFDEENASTSPEPSISDEENASTSPGPSISDEENASTSPEPPISDEENASTSPEFSISKATTPASPEIPLSVETIPPLEELEAFIEEIDTTENYQEPDGPTVPLTITIQGKGQITSTPAGMDCGDNCTQSYPINTIIMPLSGENELLSNINSLNDSMITLIPNPNPGWQFDGWRGDCENTPLTLTTDSQCTAIFSPLTLRIMVRGTGKVRINEMIDCNDDCTMNDLGVPQVTLQAIPTNNDWDFYSWLGDCENQNATLSLVMDKSMTCTAQFSNDNDSDGISNLMESQAPNHGDGNGDGILDKDQDWVTSLLDTVNNDYITVATNSNCPIKNAQINDNNTLSIPNAINWYFPTKLSFEPSCEQTPVKVFYHGVHSIFQYPQLQNENITFAEEMIGGNAVTVAEFTVKKDMDSFVIRSNKGTIKVTGLAFELNIVSFSQPAYQVKEGQKSEKMITVNRFGNFGVPVTVSYQTVDGTAKAGEDYVGTSSTITFDKHEIEKPLVIQILDNDQYEDRTKTLKILLTEVSPDNMQLGISEATLTIIEDECVPYKLNKGLLSEKCVAKDHTFENDLTVAEKNGLDNVIVEGNTDNEGNITESTLQGDVINGGIITNSTLEGEVMNHSLIMDSTLNGNITNDGDITTLQIPEEESEENPEITLTSKFQGEVINHGTIAYSTFEESVTNDNGEIIASIIEGPISNQNAGNITTSILKQTVTNEADSTIAFSVIQANVNNQGTISHSIIGSGVENTDIDYIFENQEDSDSETLRSLIKKACGFLPPPNPLPLGGGTSLEAKGRNQETYSNNLPQMEVMSINQPIMMCEPGENTPLQINNDHLIHNSTIKNNVTIEGGQLAGIIQNEGVLANFTLITGLESGETSTIIGGTLAGLIDSDSNGIFQNVKLAANTTLIGGQLEGHIIGENIPGDETIDHLARLDNITILSGTYLENVVIGDNVIFVGDVSFGVGVRFVGTTQPPCYGEGKIHHSSEPTDAYFTCELMTRADRTGFYPVVLHPNGTKLAYTDSHYVSLTVTLHVDPKHIGQLADILIGVKYNNLFESLIYTQELENWVLRSQNEFWTPEFWKDTSAAKRIDQLSETSVEEIIIYEGYLRDLGIFGEFEVYVGYRLEDGTTIHHPEPIHFSLGNAITITPQSNLCQAAPNDENDLTSFFASDLDVIRINADSRHIGQSANIYMVAVSENHLEWYDGQTWQNWNCQLDSLQPAQSEILSAEMLEIPIEPSNLRHLSDELMIYVGYRVEGENRIIFRGMTQPNLTGF